MKAAPNPEDLERYAAAIEQLFRGASSKTLRPKDVAHLESRVSEGVEALRFWASWKRSKSQAGGQ